ncbi:HGL068Wp [Eremothecium sinecaudum]|uniref:HGL068Wp n=1 Tax=Eremothecium sinecaudum TaxID=45286 RepID=A0A0X8HVK4_9SACH|nr:HGL068Wp [Eremothecium sinecaudum]AMD22272.1 HGL068Wp [Eremothecium sinecaudum]
MDPELQALREARLQELKSSQSGEKRATGELVQQFMEPEALERLSRVALVRPDRAQAVEAYLHRMVTGGMIRSKVTEKQIVDILNGIASDEQKRKETKIIFDRKALDIDEKPNIGSGGGKGAGEDSDDDFFD